MIIKLIIQRGMSRRKNREQCWVVAKAVMNLVVMQRGGSLVTTSVTIAFGRRNALLGVN
jgi:hypothetical protein